MLKLCDKTCLEIKETLFVLVCWVAKKGKLILLCHFHKKKSVPKENGNF